MSIYTYSIYFDFGGVDPVLDQIHSIIEADTNITVALVGINSNGDDVHIVFESALSGAEETVLDNIVTNYTVVPKTGEQITNISTNNDIVDSEQYITVLVFNFPGINKWKYVSNIKIIACMEDDGASFDVRVYDVTNNNEICSTNISVAEQCVSDLGELTNLPITEAIFELQVKVNGSTTVHVKNINIYHD